MISNRCKNCLWFDNVHESVRFLPIIEWKPNPGFCRKKRPGAILIDKSHVGVQPVMDADEFCGEFKKDI
jgi:hypothetical protein